MRTRALVDHRQSRPDSGVTTEEDGWTLAEEHEDIQDDAALAHGARNENAAVLEQKDPMNTVLVLDAACAANDDKVLEEAVVTNNAQMVREEFDNAPCSCKKKML